MLSPAARDNLLRSLAEQQQPSRQYKDEGKMVVHCVFESLRQSSQISVDRVRIAGSIGKGTALGDEFEPDFDLVVFVNGVKPPFPSSLLSTFEDCIRNANSGLGSAARITEIRRTRFSVQFTARVSGLDRDIGFDVLPGANLLSGPTGDVPVSQATATWEEMRGPASRGGGVYPYSSSLAEATVSFVQGVPPTLSQVIKVAKYWNKKVNLGHGIYFSGRSYIIELVAMAANRSYSDSDLETMFARFLQQMSQLSTAHIIFTDNYKENDIPPAVKARKPLSMDPVNPYNNLAEQFSVRDNLKPAIKKWEEASAITLQRLRSGWTTLDGYYNGLFSGLE